MSIAQNFFKETIDENGCLTDIQAHWPENFNFGYDVVDAIAQETPDKRAWSGAIRRMRSIFSRSEISGSRAAALHARF